MTPLTVAVRRLHPRAQLPRYAHGPGEDAGMDLCAVADVTLAPGEAGAVATGIAVELPPGYEGQIRPRSGLALKHAVTVANAPGTIDPGYRGEVKVLLINLGRAPYRVSAGDRIAQLVVAPYAAVAWDERDLQDSARGAGGFGSSGT